MSTTSLNFHGATEANARVYRVNSSNWLNLAFTDRDGAHLEIAIFSDSPEELLQAIARAADPVYDELVAALREIEQTMAYSPEGGHEALAECHCIARAALTKAAGDAS